MKKNLLKSLALVAALSVLAGCSDEKGPVHINAEGVEDLAGTWLLNEHGYSPGDRYIIEPVPAFPPQTIEFFADGRMSSNIGALSEYHFFEVVTDGQTQSVVLVLYKTAEEMSKGEQVHSYDIQFPDGEMRLSFRYCIEGCHMKFGKIEEAEPDE